MHLSNLFVFHYHSDASSCDETRKKAGGRLSNGEYMLTNGSVSFKVNEMGNTLLDKLTKAKHNFLADNLHV